MKNGIETSDIKKGTENSSMKKETLHINGVLNNTVNANFSLPNDLTVTATSIGAWLGDGGGQYFNGNIDEFRVWNAVLTPTEINNLKE